MRTGRRTAAGISQNGALSVKKKSALDLRSYFFDQGIYFECLGCGACCTGEPGIVMVYRGDLESIARHLAIDVAELVEKYLYPVRDSHSIREHEDGRCMFYRDGCAIYPARPLQCRTYPFWFENLRSPKRWKQVSGECPGIGQGRLFTKEQILEMLHLAFVECLNPGRETDGESVSETL